VESLGQAGVGAVTEADYDINSAIANQKKELCALKRKAEKAGRKSVMGFTGKC